MKVYRKIRKRQRERAGGGELGDDDRENGNLSEKAARKRAEERMSLRHKVCIYIKYILMYICRLIYSLYVSILD